MTTTLIVPIDVTAMCVGRKDVENRERRVLGPTADFAGLPYLKDGQVHNRGPYISANAVSPGAPFQGAMPPLLGVHLHWALPDGLTRGAQDGDDGSVSFPAVPDRWLLTRVVATATGDTTRRSWVVESDRLTPAATVPKGLPQPTVPTSPGAGQNYRYLGRAFDLDGWRETGGDAERLAPLTAVGYGEPTFASFYPNSSTVFGFYDTMAGVVAQEGATLSYHVAGWYADPETDPLRAGLDPTGNQVGWTYGGGPMPTRTVCAGIVHGIEWDPDRAYLTTGPGPLTAAIAGSTQEALSAFLADRLPAEPDAERLLNALQFGLLTPHDRLDLLPALDEAVHGAGFTSTTGGVLWSVVNRAAADGGDGTTGGEVTLPAELGAELDALNGLQLQLDELLRAVEARRERLFADWYKYLLILYDSPGVPASLRGRASTVRAYLSGEVAAITSATGTGGDAATLRDRIAEAAAQLASRLADLGAELGAELVLASDADAPRLYQPGDPVVVLFGPDIRPVSRYGGDGDGQPGGLLPCRLDGQLLAGVDFAAGLVPGSAATTLPVDNLPGLPARSDDAPCALVEALLREAFLVSGTLQPLVAAAIAALGGDANPAVADRTATVAALRTAAAALLAGEDTGLVGYAGVGPAPIITATWSTPWLPLLLQYEAALTPVRALDPATPSSAYPPDLVTSLFRLDDDGVDLAFAGDRLGQRMHLVSGSIILTGDATVDLAGQIERYQASVDEPDPELADALAELRALPLLSQGLTGFDDALLMRQLTLQMPVADPLAATPSQPFVAQVGAAVAGRNTVAPVPEGAFVPLRAGGLSLRRLRIVDVFGQIRDVANPRVVVAAALLPPERLRAAVQALLPPRITQPARLLFRWRSAADDTVETNSHPATSPVFGWILPERVDGGVSVAQADGVAIGQLRLRGDGATVLWTAAPGGAFPPGTPIGEVLAGADPHLREITLQLWNDGDGSFLASFLDTLTESMSFMLPPLAGVGTGAASLIGQPLALARAGLALDLGAPAATDQSWPGFQRVVIDGTAPWDGGLGGVRFPVRLGGLIRLGDTLVGFWLDRDGHGSDGTFYSDAARGDHGPVRRPAPDTIALGPASSTADATMVTLLLDPRGPVHATTGILPVKAIDLPPDQYAPALSTVEAVLAFGPVPSGSNRGDLVLPLPRIAEGSWSWVEAAGQEWRGVPLRDPDDDRAALASTPQRLHEGWLRLRRGG